ncbi:protein NPG1-like [Vitis riparia]|uniref:protein NPG1-like n=1 Tax=Vitis riparia TaxID=96939 RepID=UPI00155AECBA|nr:protein NPG1-like [Vitis riparia]
MMAETATAASESAEEVPVRELCVNGTCVKTDEFEAKLDEGNIEEAESSLRETFSLTSEDARALLGKLEYQRGKMEGVLRVFEGMDFQAAIQKLLPPPDEKTPPRKARSRPGSMQAVSQQPAGPVIEALYLKSKCLQKLGRTTEAADECKGVLDAVEKIFPLGIPEVLAEKKLQEILNQAAELLPELWKQADNYNEVMAAYRRALLSQWNLDNDCCARIQKRFAMFLLYSGVEAGPPSLAAQIDGSYVPRNNLEEAILLLMILTRKYYLGKTKWDQSVMDHLGFALSLCRQTSVLAKKFEEAMPGVFPRDDRWKALALCYVGAGENGVSLNLLRKSLHKDENPDDLVTLLLAAKICSEDSLLAAEGVEYARRAISNANGADEHLKGVGLRLLGLCLGKQARVAPSDFERSRLLSEALKSLDGAIALEQNNPDLIFELAVQYAEHRNLSAALHYAKQFTDATGGSMEKGWRLLAVVLSAQQRYPEAEVVIDAALDETAKWEQGPLLRLKAQLKIAQSLPMDAIEIYRYLLALVQAQKNSFGSTSQGEDDRINEFEVWNGLANLYSSLSRWKDAEICLGKALELKDYSVESLHQKGVISEGCGQVEEAMKDYVDAILLDPDYVPCLVLLSALMARTSTKMLPVARSLLSDALKLQPTNSMAWYFLGVVHKNDGRIADATDCFQAASILEESNPIERFGSML